MAKKVTIVGAGPSGILLALYLLRRRNYQIDIYERRGDPRNAHLSKSKNYPLVLCQRGLTALRKIEGLEDAVKSAGIELEKAVSFNNRSQKYESGEKKLLTINRNNLVITLLNYLERNYDQEQFQIHFEYQYVQADFRQKQAIFQKSDSNETSGELNYSLVDYDYLIGADGVHSMVRNNCLSTGSFEFEQKCTHLAYKNLFVPPDEISKSVLELGRVSGWRSPDGVTLLASRQRDSSISCTLFISTYNNPLGKVDTVNKLRDYLAQNFAELGLNISDDTAEEFLQIPLAKIWTVSCSNYHYKNSVLIVGDAAHAISPLIGQGCNSALEDILVLDSCLEKYQDDWEQVLPEYSRVRVHDAHAVRELADNALPLNQGMFIFFLLKLFVARKMHKLFPKTFDLPFFDLIPHTTLTYSEIHNSSKNWIARVKKSNERFLRNVEISKIN